ncbi:apolipoprotein N-acyltransferase [Shewanella sp. OPT22]|nr:apolipoprotein N-acyltransferase [Shewanella sp. OPT22]
MSDIFRTESENGHKFLHLVAAFLAGASCTLSFAPYNIWIILPFAFAFSLWQSKSFSAKSSFKYWLSFGFGYFAVGISWVHVSMSEYGGIPLIVSMFLMALLALYLALFPAFVGYLTQKFAAKQTSVFKTLLLFPALWTTFEWLRGLGAYGFPWLWAGYSQTEGPLSQLAPSIGALGLSFTLMLVAACIALLFQRKLIPLAVTFPIVALLTWFSPSLSNIHEDGKSFKLAMVQGNIAQSTKWRPDALWPTMIKYMDLTRDNFNADVIIWPEAAIPAPQLDPNVTQFLATANEAATLNNSAIITGIIGLKNHEFFNQMIVLGNSEHKQQAHGDYVAHGANQYKKHHLLPIGEFVPLQSILRPIAPLFNLPMSSFTRGDYVQPDLKALGYHFTTAICFEIAFPEQVRANLKANSDVLLTVSNDAWFGTSNGPLQHMQIAQMRALELGRPLVRATNNGVTAVVNEHGKITEKLPQFETGVLRADIKLIKGETLFYRLGQWPILVFCGVLIFIGIMRKLIR